MFPLFNNELLAPVTEAPPTSSFSKEDIVDFLADDKSQEVIELDPTKTDDKKEEKKDGRKEEAIEEKSDDEEGEEVDELKEIEEELEGPTEEQLELSTPAPRREILKKYPNLFKDFPYLEKAYYREQQFTELLPTIEDAKSVIEKADILDKFELDLTKGNTKNILQGVKNEDPRAFAKLVDEYLPTLARVDEKAYHHVIGNTIKHTIVAMVQEARRSDNEALQVAASVLNQFVFGSSEFQPIKNLSESELTNEESQKEDRIAQREQEFNRRQFETAQSDLNSRINSSIKLTIENNIDPKDSMTAYVKKNASREAIEMVENLISRDSRFKIIVDKLWEKAGSENFSKPSVDRIKSAYLSKAKTLLPSVIKKARNEALRGMGKRVVDDDNEIELTSSNNSAPKNEQRPRSNTGKIKSAKDIPAGMRTIDFLMQD